MKGFFVSLGDPFEKHGAAQTGILTNKSHYKETRSLFVSLSERKEKVKGFFCISCCLSKCLSERKEKVKGFFKVSLGDLFEKHGAAQTKQSVPAILEKKNRHLRFYLPQFVDSNGEIVSI